MLNDKIKLLVDCWYGCHTIDVFIKNYDMEKWNCKDFADEYLTADGDDEMRSYIADDILNSAHYVDDTNHTWSLYFNDSLYAIRDDYEWED